MRDSYLACAITLLYYIIIAMHGSIISLQRDVTDAINILTHSDCFDKKEYQLRHLYACICKVHSCISSHRVIFSSIILLMQHEEDNALFYFYKHLLVREDLQ